MTRRSECTCCGGTGEVLSILGSPRPCSRCDKPGFDVWMSAHRPVQSRFKLQPDNFKPRDRA